MDRRTYLHHSAILMGATASGVDHFIKRRPKSKFKIGACDWSIGQRGKLEAFDVGRKIGLDGIQISYRVNPEEEWLSRADIQRAYLQRARSHQMSVASLALGILNQIPYKSDERAEAWVLGSIKAAKQMGIKIVLLAFFGDGDIKHDKKGTKVVVERLKTAAKEAEEAGVILGIESWLSAEEHVDIIDAVGSDHIKVYYDVANSHKMGYDIYEEIRWLGKDLICEFHAKENGYLLGKGLVDFKKVRKSIEDIGYEGWIQIEGAVPKGADMYKSYRKNNRVLRRVF